MKNALQWLFVGGCDKGREGKLHMVKELKKVDEPVSWLPSVIFKFLST